MAKEKAKQARLKKEKHIAQKAAKIKALKEKKEKLVKEKAKQARLAKEKLAKKKTTKQDINLTRETLDAKAAADKAYREAVKEMDRED